MRGSRIPNPMVMAATVIAAGVVLSSAATAMAADFDRPPASGQPIVLFSPSMPFVAPPPVTNITAPTPSRRQKALIPPAALPARLSPPPLPRPALSLETDLQPVAPAPPSDTGATASPATKPPPG